MEPKPQQHQRSEPTVTPARCSVLCVPPSLAAGGWQLLTWGHPAPMLLQPLLLEAGLLDPTFGGLKIIDPGA